MLTTTHAHTARGRQDRITPCKPGSFGSVASIEAAGATGTIRAGGMRVLSILTMVETRVRASHPESYGFRFQGGYLQDTVACVSSSLSEG